MQQPPPLPEVVLERVIRLARVSGVAARISGPDIPLSAPARAVVASVPDLFPSLVAGGDDYEILAAVAPDQAPAFEAAAAKAGIAVTIIGQLTAGTGLEVTVVVIGLLLGGVLGLGTVVYALAIGPLTQLMLPWFTVDLMTPSAD